MLLPILLLIPLAFALALPLGLLLVRAGHRVGALDSAGAPGHVKTALRPVPNIGGVAIVAAVLLPMLGGLALLRLLPADRWATWLPVLAEAGAEGTLLDRALGSAPAALWMIAGAALLHGVGLLDDRRGLPAAPKLVAQLVAATVAVVLADAQLLTLLPAPLSLIASVVWIVAIANAINFLDNMDGLAGGVAAIAAALFLAATLVNGQWFVAAVLALLLGALIGFLALNFPPARIFMGDGGSLVVGYLLAVLAARTTWYHEALGGAWYGVFMPLVVLAVPLYDLVAVTAIRLRQGRSPFVGDQQHFSHRLVMLGLSRRGAVVVIWCATAVTGIGGISLGRLLPWQAALVVGQVALVLLSLALFEHAARRGRAEPAR